MINDSLAGGFGVWGSGFTILQDSGVSGLGFCVRVQGSNWMGSKFVVTRLRAQDSGFRRLGQASRTS